MTSLSPATRLPMTAGRRIALVLGVPVALVIVFYGSFGIVGNLGRASYPVADTFHIPGNHLAMSLDGGNLDVRADPTAGDVAHLTGTVSYSLARPALRIGDTGHGTSIQLGCPWLSMANCSLDASLAVPAGTAVNVSTGGGDLSVSGLSGMVSASTDGGNVNATFLSDGVTLSTGGGDVTVSQLSGTVSLHTDGGNITGTGIMSTQVSAATGGGDIQLTLTEVPRDLTVSTDGGDVTIVVPKGVYYVQAHTDGGTVQKNVETSSSSSSPHHITATSGGGDITINQS